MVGIFVGKVFVACPEQNETHFVKAILVSFDKVFETLTKFVFIDRERLLPAPLEYFSML